MEKHFLIMVHHFIDLYIVYSIFIFCTLWKNSESLLNSSWLHSFSDIFWWCQSSFSMHAHFWDQDEQERYESESGCLNFVHFFSPKLRHVWCLILISIVRTHHNQHMYTNSVNLILLFHKHNFFHCPWGKTGENLCSNQLFSLSGINCSTQTTRKP